MRCGGPDGPAQPNRLLPSAFVTSANFTEAAQERNIETGVLVSDPSVARGLRDQFESLVTAGRLRRVPGAR